MTTKQKHSKNEAIKFVLGEMGDIFRDLSEESLFSKELIELNVSTDLSKFAEAIVKNPIEPSFKFFKVYANIIIELLNEVAINSLKKHKAKIAVVYKPNPNALIFNIVLKTDTPSNRARILDFVFNYERTVYARHFRIVFTFIPKEFERSIKGNKLPL